MILLMIGGWKIILKQWLIVDLEFMNQKNLDISLVLMEQDIIFTKHIGFLCTRQGLMQNKT